MRRRSLESSTQEDVDDSLPDVDSTSRPTVDNGDGGVGGASSLRDAAKGKLRSVGDSSIHSSQVLDRRKSIDSRSISAHRGLPDQSNWKQTSSRNASLERKQNLQSNVPADPAITALAPTEKMSGSRLYSRRSSARSPWSSSILIITATALAAICFFSIVHSFDSRQLDPKGCRMSYMWPAYAKLSDFDTEHTRFASKYSVYLYREVSVDEDTKVKGVPVLFIPGNAGSYKQVRPIAAEAATFFSDVLRHDPGAISAGARTLDFFTVDFNEDITAFHGQTLLDQAEYLNEAVAYILSLYHDPRRSDRDPDLPDPTSVIILGHSMGGIVARTMLVMPNYQSNSINTIITMSAPHARPPVSFDAEIVDTYKHINEYWRKAYSQKWANNNPLWHVTLISIAGGGLDTVVPSDYASLESLVPETHGFTVFTSTIPTVWTGMDHQAILWCDQFRKVVVKALYDVIDVNRATQTKPRADRMLLFKKWFLTGMEDVAEKRLPQKDPTTLLTLEDNSNSIIAQGERLTLRKLGQPKRSKAFLLPIPPLGTPGGRRFTLLSDQILDHTGEDGKLEVLFCSVFPLHPGQSATIFSMNMDLSGDSSGSTRLACKNAADDLILLPASTRTSKHPFYLQGDEVVQPFSYLQYELDDIADHQFVAVVDKALAPSNGWVVAEFSDNVQSRRIRHLSLRRLLTFGTTITLPATRPMVTEVKIPSLHSSLLAYNLDVSNQACGDEAQLFTPFLRQYLSEPYESKYFVNLKQASINLHGVAPFMPPALKARNSEDGLSLQFWTDPTCNSTIQATLKIDIPGSWGKLYMRYRMVFAAFPLLVVALVLRKQFRVYDNTGVFISFTESMDACLRRSLPLMLLLLTILSFSFAGDSTAPSRAPAKSSWGWNHSNATESATDFTKNDLLLGSQDPFFWFLVPVFGLICVGTCVLINYVTLALTQVLCSLYTLSAAGLSHLRGGGSDDKRRNSNSNSSAAIMSATAPAAAPAFYMASPRRRILVTAALLFMVSTIIPYQFAYLVACLVQLATCTRALRLARETRDAGGGGGAGAGGAYGFYNYAHSVLVLMLWVLPINLPVLVVWMHNLAVHWLTPFSSHHNVLSITPFILLVEFQASGGLGGGVTSNNSSNSSSSSMVPRAQGRLPRAITSLLLLAVAGCAAVYGVSHAYMLHHLVNVVAAWLFVLHCSGSPALSLARIGAMLQGQEAGGNGGSGGGGGGVHHSNRNINVASRGGNDGGGGANAGGMEDRKKRGKTP